MDFGEVNGMAKDPVCGMDIDPADAVGVAYIYSLVAALAPGIFTASFLFPLTFYVA